MKIASDVTALVGNTPLVAIRRLAPTRRAGSSPSSNISTPAIA